jgi:hypothetical protein
MYGHCPTCAASLGRNEILESFPVGRRLAFDPEKGRLWVLCDRCRSWALTPIEERWEPVEEAEKAFRAAEAGVSTENLALARHREGTELIRVGRAPVREVAGWRYGRRLVGRWRRHRREGWIAAGIGVSLGSIPFMGNAALPVFLGWAAVDSALRFRRRRRPAVRIDEGEGLDRIIRAGDLRHARLLSQGERGWALEVSRGVREPRVLEGPEALSALRVAFPTMNEKGGKPAQVNRAVDRVLELGDPDRVLARAASDLQKGQDWNPAIQGLLPGATHLKNLNATLRLSLEIAANEQVERRALEGELKALEREWQRAEEIAAIADDLLFPRALRKRLDAMRKVAGR